MDSIPSIDLHPEAVGGQGPEQALRACRDFLDRSLRAGHKQVRLITGLGLRGDGTPRLRNRVEREVLGSYSSCIEQRAYEQGGAVIRLWLKAPPAGPSMAWRRQQRRQAERRDLAQREERLMVAWDRLQLAEDAWEEGDLRRCRLKLNQVAREFGWPSAEGPLDPQAAARLLDQHRERLNAMDK